MSEKSKEWGKIINIPHERWGSPRVEKQKSNEQIGSSMDFSFFGVPFDVDGEESELEMDLPENDEKDVYLTTYKSGVEIMETIDVGLIPSPLGLSLNINGVTGINKETHGALLRFTGGDSVGRYLLLAKRRQELDVLRGYVPKMSTEFRKRFLEVLIKNADLALERYADRAALVIN